MEVIISDEPGNACFDHEVESDNEDQEHSDWLEYCIARMAESDSDWEQSSEKEEQSETSSDNQSESESESEEISATEEVPQMSQPDMVSCHKVIVSLPSLIELLPKKCQHDCCQLPVQSNYKFGGCSVAITQTCLLGHEWVWRSGALHRDKKKAAMFANNLLLGAAILMSGNNFAKVERMFQMVNLHCISESTFYRYQRVYVAPAINQVSTEYKKQVIQRFSNADVVVSGDGRCDSPGSSAKFCTYTLMEKESGVILHTETVDKREVEYKSPNMEREALRRALKYINSTSVHVNELTTDASRSIMTMLADQFPAMYHSLDVWHKAKKLRKTLLQAGKKAQMHKIAQWSESIYNHFWYCCSSCDRDVETLKSKWQSLLHHVQNEHVWVLGHCDHITDDGEDLAPDPPTDKSGNPIPYFLPNEPATEALKNIVLDHKWMDSLKYYVRFRHTGLLESFHSLMLAYCPKRVPFMNEAYHARIQLAVIDHNFHLSREQAVKKTGEKRYHRRHRKRTNRWDATAVQQRKTYSYIPSLLQQVLLFRAESKEKITRKEILPESHPARITPTIARVQPPPTHEIVHTKKSRFSLPEQ